MLKQLPQLFGQISTIVYRLKIIVSNSKIVYWPAHLLTRINESLSLLNIRKTMGNKVCQIKKKGFLLLQSTAVSTVKRVPNLSSPVGNLMAHIRATHYRLISHKRRVTLMCIKLSTSMWYRQNNNNCILWTVKINLNES